MKIRKFDIEQTATPDRLSYELTPECREEAGFLRNMEGKTFFHTRRGNVTGCKRFLCAELHEVRKNTLVSEASNEQLIDELNSRIKDGRLKYTSYG